MSFSLPLSQSRCLVVCETIIPYVFILKIMDVVGWFTLVLIVPPSIINFFSSKTAKKYTTSYSNIIRNNKQRIFLRVINRIKKKKRTRGREYQFFFFFHLLTSFECLRGEKITHCIFFLLPSHLDSSCY